MPGETGTRPALIRQARHQPRFVFPSFLTSSNAVTVLRQAAGSLLSAAFPSVCSLCRQELTELNLTGVCLRCWVSLEPWRGTVCSCCGLPIVSERLTDRETTLCPACRHEEMSFDCARSFGLYRDSLRAAILLLKFQRRARWGRKLGTLLATVFENLTALRGAASALIVPVPLHAARERERSYNQAELLSRGLVRTAARSRSSVEARLECGVLKKISATPPQTGLSLAARHDNVRGVFAVRRPERVRDQAVVLVDDVMTTGATLSACAAVLKRAGAREVLAVTLARATPQFPDSGSDHEWVNIDEFVSRR